MKIHPGQKGTIEVIIWALLAFLAASSIRTFKPMPLSNDSYQYLSVADNVRSARGIATSLVHFDTERSHGRIPAPLTTFPPGYPVAIAATAKVSGDLETAGRLLSGLCYAGTAALLLAALVAAGTTVFVRQIILCMFCANAVCLEFSTAVMSESLYMLLSTGAVVALLWAERRSTITRGALTWAVLGYVLAGLSYYVRYAGLFLIAALVSHALLQLLLHRNRTRVVLLAAALIPLICVAPLMLRNIAYVGTWKGGNEMPVHNALKGVAADYVRAQLHLFLGQHQVTFKIWEALLLAGAFTIAALLISLLRKGGWWVQPAGTTLLVLLCVIVYTVAMLCAAWRTDISFGTRYFQPILPLYLILLGIGSTRLMSRWTQGPASVLLKLGFVVATIGYAGINARDLLEPLPPAEYELLAKEYAEPASNGEPLLKWIDSHMATRDPIASAEGQATGYLLHRPTMSLVGNQFSRERWECDEVKRQMERFGARYLILYKPPPSNIDEESLLKQSNFVATAVSRQPPCGFVIAIENPRIRILRIDDAALPAGQK